MRRELLRRESEMKNISHIVDSGLCLGCGTCAGICPLEAIEMKVSEGIFSPTIREELCSSCQICVKACPGHSMDLAELSRFVFGKQYEGGLLGNYLNCYVGHSNDMDIRYNSASGGLASQILIFALDEGVIDGAIVVRMRDDAPLETEAFIAKSKEEVLDAARSKYCPVTLGKAIRQILREDGRFAVVGLPCHIEGIRKAEQLSDRLRRRIKLHIGLLCSHTVSFTGTELLVKKLGIRKEDVVDLRYRGEGWPGSMTIKTKSGQCFKIPLFGSWHSYWPLFSSFLFAPLRCIMCPDQAAELSDISLGDAWLPQMKNERNGESIIITRTEEGEKIVKALNSAGLISARLISPNEVIISQALNLKFKKKDLSPRLKILRSLGEEIPHITSMGSGRSSTWDYPKALVPYFSIRISSNRFCKKVMEYTPFPLFRIYFRLCKVVFSL
jgi:coenzyme F420 hydrogenase subunit beta